jgi:hypothetical protein
MEPDLVLFERTFDKINNASRTEIKKKEMFSKSELNNLYNAWNILDEGYKKELEKSIRPETEAPTQVLLSRNSTLYKDIKENPETQQKFAFDKLVYLIKLNSSLKDSIITAIIKNKVLKETNELLEVSLTNTSLTNTDSNFLKTNANYFVRIIVNIVNLMLLIFCSLFALSRLLSRKDIRDSPDIRAKIVLIKKAIMQYYTNLINLMINVIGVFTGAKKALFIVIFIGIYLVLSYIDPNNYVINAVMFPISFPVYCITTASSSVGIDLNNIFWSHINVIMDVISHQRALLIDKIHHIFFSFLKDNIISLFKDELIEWFKTEGVQNIAEQIQHSIPQIENAVQSAVQGSIPQIQDAVQHQFQVSIPQIQDAVQHQFQVSIPQIQDAVQHASQTNLLELQEIISRSLSSCQIITAQHATMLSEISNDPTILEQFTKSLSGWGNLLQDSVIKAGVRAFIEYKGNTRSIGYGGRKSRKNRKVYKKKTKKHIKKKSNKRIKRVKKINKKSKKY